MAEIGYRLIRAREARGLTLEDAERDTRISRRYLEALEDEQFEVIPAPVYARGFLRSYAQYLGMDPQELLAFFPRGDEGPANGTSAPSRASMENPIPGTSPSRPTWRQPPRFDSGRGTRPDARTRRRQGPLPPRPATLTPPPGEAVIGAETPARSPLPRARKVEPSAAAAGPPGMIGQEAGPAPTRRLQQHPAGNQRNLIVIGAGIGLAVIIAIAAILIATVGGGDDGPLPPGSPATTTSPAEAATAAGGVQPGVVPDVIGESRDDAIRMIQQAGLTPRVLTEASAEREGTVINQSPAPGTQRPSGSEVRIVVSAGQ